MNIQRTKHIVFSLGLLEKMSDADLAQALTGSKSPTQKRQYLNKLRNAGFEFFPCSCENHGPRGECLGFDEAADVAR